MEMENRKHAVTNTHSANHSLRNTETSPIGLSKFSTYIYQYTTADTQQSQQIDTHIGPRKLTIPGEDSRGDHGLGRLVEFRL